MDEIEFRDMVFDLLDEQVDNDDYCADEDDSSRVVKEVMTFEDVGMLSASRGIVVRMADGAEFQVSVVRSK